MQEVITCPVCERGEFFTLFSCVDHTFSHETFVLRECTNCKLLITTPRPSEKELARYYLSDSYISHSNSTSSLVDVVYKAARHFTLKWKYDLVKNNVASNLPFKLLDFGCGTGDFIKKCKHQGNEVEGVEPSDIARYQAQQKTGATIADSIQNISNTFDVITLWHVLEHIPDPNKIIQELLKRMNDSGTIFIAVPNHLSYDAMKYKEKWAGYDVPRHLWHFSPGNMELLLKKNNLTQVKILPMKLDAFYVSMLSEKYKSGNQNITSIMKGFLSGIRSNQFARQNNNYSSLIYIARKK